MRISDWSSDVCSSDLFEIGGQADHRDQNVRPGGGAIEIGFGRGRNPLPREIDAAGRVDRDRIAMAALQRHRLHRRQEIGIASCRERVCQYVKISVVAVIFINNNKTYHIYINSY